MRAIKHFVLFIEADRHDRRHWARLLKLFRQDPLRCPGYEFDGIDLSGSENKLEELHRVLTGESSRYRVSPDQYPPHGSPDAPLAYAELAAREDPLLILVGIRAGANLIRAYLLNLLRVEPDPRKVEVDVRQIRRVEQVLLYDPAPQDYLTWIKHIFRFLAISTLLVAFVAFGAWIWREATGQTLSMMGKERSPLDYVVVFSGIACLLALPMSNEIRDFLFRGPKRRREEELRRQDEENLAELFDDRVKRGRKDKSGTWPVPVREFARTKINASRKAEVDEFAQQIAATAEHRHIFTVDRYERTYAISPIDRKQIPLEFRKLEHMTEPYNLAIQGYNIHFSNLPQPRCGDGGELPYWYFRKFTNGRLLVKQEPEGNKSSSLEKEVAKKNMEFIYRFEPKRSKTYLLELAIYGGYNVGDRNSHMHLPANSRFNQVVEVLDLRAYLSQGWKIPAPPEAYFIPGNIPETHGDRNDVAGTACNCVRDGWLDPRCQQLEVIPDINRPGVYSWSVYDLRDGGQIGFRFRVDKQQGDENEKRASQK